MNTAIQFYFKPLRRTHLLIAIIAFGGLFALSYPYYRYFVDPDAVAYLTMAKTAAAGEPWRLVNALWSPLHPAIVAVLIKLGADALFAAQITNAAACVWILIASYVLFRRFNVSRDIGFPLLSALSIFLTYALYKQLFCDLFQVAFLLSYISIISRHDFLQKPLWWLISGLLMALAAYAKVYSFYFLLVYFPIALWIISKNKQGNRFPWKPYLTAFIFQALLLVPLVVLMHEKYGFWGLSKSGALNTSWTLVGHKSPKPEIQALIPPPYANSPYTWEDPFMSEGVLHSRFESIAILKSQIGHSFQAILQGFEAANQISPLLLVMLAGSILVVIFKRNQTLFNQQHQLLIAAMSIMPLGYLLLHFEARYIWLLLPLSMVIASVFLERFRHWTSSKTALRMAVFLTAVSFIAYPTYDMKQLFRKGEDVYRISQALTKLNIRGSFTSNDNPSRSGCLAYWLGCNYYTPAKEHVTHDEVMADMNRYRVTFYFHHQNSLDIATALLPDLENQPAQRVDGGRIPGLQVFVVAP